MKIWVVIYTLYGINEGSYIFEAYKSEEKAKTQVDKFNAASHGGWGIEECELRE